MLQNAVTGNSAGFLALEDCMNATNATEALRAAADCIECGDSKSALEYMAVAAVELADCKKAGVALIYSTADAIECVARGQIDPDDDADDGPRPPREGESLCLADRIDEYGADYSKAARGAA